MKSTSHRKVPSVVQKEVEASQSGLDRNPQRRCIRHTLASVTLCPAGPSLHRTEHFHAGIFNSTAANYSAGLRSPVCAATPGSSRLSENARNVLGDASGLYEIRLPRGQIRQCHARLTFPSRFQPALQPSFL